jgi:indole-3-glycerol phosphate synthase / phosphoribosylanthranilate isomerase
VALEAIVARKREDVARRMAERPLASFRGEVGPTDRSLRAALARERTGFILECKKASPSQGLIRSDFDARAIARSYAPFCDAVSVLCDEPYFQGSFDHLRAVRETVTAPVLCKDFVVDPYQVYEARGHGADAILLMCSVLNDAEIAECLRVCRSLGMDALVEVHDEEELSRALALDAPVIGINNRDLETLKIDLATTGRLAPNVPRDRVVVCESGIEEHAQVVSFRATADAFLVGTSMMREARLDDAVRRLMFGRVKICGLTRGDDARAAREAGAIFGGLVFWPQSPRAVTVAQARTIRDSADLQWVGVFVDEEPSAIASAARELPLAAVQLHGHETRATIDALRPQLPEGCAIWKAVRVGDPEYPVPANAAEIGADRLLFDTYRRDMPGGTGQTFDWAAVQSHPSAIVSGGITAENAVRADGLGWAIDLSSGVESSPGKKDPEKLTQLFAALRGKGRGA